MELEYCSFQSVDGNPEIYIMKADGTNQTRLTNNLASDSFAVWAPNASRIAFVSERNQNAEIYVVNVDGTNERNLTNNTTTDFSPSWSPNGSQIAFESDRDGNFEIYVMNADGTNPQRLTNIGGRAPVRSPVPLQ